MYSSIFKELSENTIKMYQLIPILKYYRHKVCIEKVILRLVAHYKDHKPQKYIIQYFEKLPI